MDNNEHVNWMMQAIMLAANGAGYVSPNPMVGAVLVHQGQMIGAGYHMQYGQAHAEPNCLNSVSDENKSKISESTLYVSLEPCCHTGKTPPCTDAIIKAGIKRVVIACTDPNPLVGGKGIAVLRNHGVEVITNILEQQAITFNRRFFKHIQQKMPYVILKWAQSSDGFISKQEGSSTQITSKEANEKNHAWRAQEDAILVGYNTVVIDNPLLTVRHVDGRNPIRFVWDNKNTLRQKKYAVFNNEAPTYVLTQHKISDDDIKFESIENFLKHLYAQKIQSIIIEGGTKTIQKFIDAQLWDEARVIVGLQKFGSGVSAPELSEYQFLYHEQAGPDIINYYKHNKNIYF